MRWKMAVIGIIATVHLLFCLWEFHESLVSSVRMAWQLWLRPQLWLLVVVFLNAQTLFSKEGCIALLQTNFRGVRHDGGQWSSQLGSEKGTSKRKEEEVPEAPFPNRLHHLGLTWCSDCGQWQLAPR